MHWALVLLTRVYIQKYICKMYMYVYVYIYIRIIYIYSYKDTHLSTYTWWHGLLSIMWTSLYTQQQQQKQ